MGERKSNKQRIIIFVTVLFIAAANIITIILVSNTEDNYNKLVIDSDSQKIESEIQQNNKLESIKIPGYKKVYFPADEKEVQLNLVNPEGNKCYFKFQLCVEDEILYSSDFVKGGYSIDTLELTHSLDPGEYELAIKITPYDLDGITKLNGANINTKLLVY